MGRSPSRSRPPYAFLALALLVGSALVWVHRIPAGKHPAADRVRLAVARIVGWVTPARAATPESATSAPSARPVVATRKVERVVDGDTVVLDGNEKVRLIGINTPESVDPRRPVQWYGKEASAFTKALLLGRRVRMEFDVERKDRYGRTLGYLWLEDGTFVNLRLVEDGYAFSYPYPPNVAHAAEFRDAEKRAREAKRGLWSDAAKAREIQPKPRK
jgi:endonuclease YncB( thermonuclease family)